MSFRLVMSGALAVSLLSAGCIGDEPEDGMGPLPFYGDRIAAPTSALSDTAFGVEVWNRCAGGCRERWTWCEVEVRADVHEITLYPSHESYSCECLQMCFADMVECTIPGLDAGQWFIETEPFFYNPEEPWREAPTAVVDVFDPSVTPAE